MALKLITEVNESLEILTEENNGKKQYFIEGVFLQADVQNRNGRIYPSEVLDGKIEAYIKEYVEKNRAFGELGHPDGPQINLDRVSHIIKELRKDGSNWVGKALLMDTPMGKIAKNILDAGGRIGVSSRALGSLVQREGYNEVQNDLHIVTAADIVADPSAPDAFVEGIMEGREWICEGGIFKAITPAVEVLHEQTQRKINRVVRDTKHDRQLREQAFLAAFYDYLSKISDQ